MKYYKGNQQGNKSINNRYIFVYTFIKKDVHI